MKEPDGAIVAHEVSENTAEYEPDSDSDATLADRIMELWVNAGGSDDRLQGLRGTEGSRGLPGLLGSALLHGAAAYKAALRVVALTQSVGTERLTTVVKVTPEQVDEFFGRGFYATRVIGD